MIKKISALFFLLFLLAPSLALADERCPDYCERGIFYSGRTYDLRAAACSSPTDRLTCEFGCDSSGCLRPTPTVAPTAVPTRIVPTQIPPTSVPAVETRSTIQVQPTATVTVARTCINKGGSLDCEDYCACGIAYTGAIKTADGSCKYQKQENCEKGCDPTGKGCLGKVCLDKCIGNASYSNGSYEDGDPLAKGCIYKEVVPCNLGCDPLKKECKRCSTDADCKSTCKLGVLSTGKCDQNVAGSGCVFNSVACTSTICNPLKNNLCGLKIGPAYFTDTLDGKVKPIPEAKVMLSWSYPDGKGGTTEVKLPDRATDINGNISVSDNELYKFADNPEAKLTVKVYLEDFKKRFFVKDMSVTNPAPYIPLSLRTISMNDPETYFVDFNFNKPVSSIDKPSQNRKSAKIYYHNWEAMRFGEDILKVPMNYFTPEPVLFNNPGCGACHSSSADPNNPGDSGISYTGGTSSLYNVNSAENLEWHEYCHHIMVDEFNYMPWDNANCNHCGYGNPNSGDSWIEGWAEFCALAIKDYYQYPVSYVYANFGSMEVNYKVTVDEEFAVASALWDLYDKEPKYKYGAKNNPVDGVQLSIEQIWSVLKGQYVFPGETAKRHIHNFSDIYWAFGKSNLPGLKGDVDKDGINNLDEIFIVRDVYGDKNKNQKWDKLEPIGITFKPSNSTKVRPNRPQKPGAFIGISLKDNNNKEIPDTKTKIKVTFQNDSCGLGENCDYEYWAPVEEGKVYLEPPTADFDAIVEIEVFSNEKFLKLAKFTVKEYWQKYNADKPLVESYDLKVEDFQNIPESPVFLTDVIYKAAQEKVMVQSSELSNGVYKMSGFTNVKLLRIIPMKMKVMMEIDSQTGNVLKLTKPWWSFLTLSV